VVPPFFYRFSVPTVESYICAQAGKDDVLTDVNEATMNIVLKMIETGKIIIDAETGPDKQHKQNTKYIEEVCKAYKTVLKTVLNPKDD